MSKLTRKQIREGLNTVPVEAILGKGVTRELTPKEKRFAMEVAQGASKTDAYRKAYKHDASPHTLRKDPYVVASKPSVAQEIEAYQAAIEAARYRTPAALRELVIQSLVSVVINPDAKDSVKVAAAKVLGTVTEVAAFTERKEIKTISSSEDARAKIIGEIKRLMTNDADDVAFTETQADDLLAELTGSPESETEGGGQAHPSPAPQNVSEESRPDQHTIPHEQTSDLQEPPPSFLEGGPVGEGVEIGNTPLDGTKG